MSLDVAQLPLGPFETNCYLVRQDGASDAVVIDPGFDAAAIRLELATRGARCTAILITHGDVDHIGAVADLAEGTGAPVHMAEDERERLERANDFVPAGIPVRVRSYAPDVLLKGDELLDLAGISFETLRIPGHSAGHLAFAANGALFSGDLVFAGSVGRTDRPGADHEALLASVAMLAERLPPETVIYPGHGPATTLGHELATNPFLAELRASAR
ncbi:MAG TPA: MBL fold metallo-hydrolase [Gaiellaceae bacterium]|jgi:hydroxyacylglutathione hydrolase|nr:MBL fold metallo-hydrolase [Gaiellaceae bacterium]